MFPQSGQAQGLRGHANPRVYLNSVSVGAA